MNQVWPRLTASSVPGLTSVSLSLALALSPSCAGPAAVTPAERLRELKQGASERAGLVLAHDAFGDSASRLVYLDQGWGVAETLWFYHADQGSMLMPYDMLVNLEQAGSDRPIIDPDNLARYRFLNLRKTPDNPHGLPIGFSRHEDQVGFTCAACHTTQINYRGTAMRIDGAPGLADVASFLEGVRDALAATLADPAKLARYAARGGRGGQAKREAAARADLQRTLDWFQSYLRANHSRTREGFARLDAVGRIINQVVRFTSDPKNSLEPNAPVNYPLLWDTPRHDYVQWTGFAPNEGPGSLGRNTGEVIGVFGQVKVKHYETKGAATLGYPSSINALALVAMEESLRGLKSPVWPEDILPPIDRALAARGQALYQAHCVTCHQLIDRAAPHRRVVAMMTATSEVKTDDTSARNLVSARLPSGILQGALSPNGERYAAEVPALALLVDLGLGVLRHKPAPVVLALLNAKVHGLEKTPKQGSRPVATAEAPLADLMAYKARPLNGTWASSPYLHNGSVPTLYELLLPGARRPRTFAVGRLEYDPRKVGYVSEGREPFVLDTAVPGNSNQGHEYGTALSDDERWALVEYLKTL